MKIRITILLFSFAIIFSSCTNDEKTKQTTEVSKTHDYFLLRPEAEKTFGYSHAVRIGNYLIISGAVSMDDAGVPTAVGDLKQQMKNCYSDLEKVLTHYGYTFDDVVVENIFTTNMAEFLNQSGYRNDIYKKNFPTGTWLEVKGLALPEFMIEIELEAHKSK
ncbi:MAG: RidA family protein [Ignavibacteriales bacterium]|nr:MAG: RidA family protein [Ignavibacteriales bacterium]